MGLVYKTMVCIMGLIAGISGAFMVLPMICAFYYNDMEAAQIFGITGVLSLTIGFCIYKFMPRSRHPMHSRDAYLIVFGSWIVCSLIGALPYFFSGEITSFCDAIFEAVAGFTTTGATALGESNFTEPFILWKAITHWLGAMGILIFVITVLPSMGSGGQRIVAAESPGAGLSATSPRSKDLAKLLYLIYSTLTLSEFILLYFGSDMGAFEALINSLGSISTAGLTFHPSGVAYYDSVFVECVLSVFTILASVNFLLFIYLIKRNFNHIKKSYELRAYLAFIAVTTLFITADLTSTETYQTFGASLRHAFFTVNSFMTTSGLVLSDYNTWPTFSKMILFSMLFVGGCVASTSGSVKMLRILVMLKLVRHGFFKKLHPRSVKAVRIGENNITAAMVSSVTSFIAMYFATFMVASVVIAFSGHDLETSMGAAASLMSTTGASFGDIGASGNYSAFSGPMKLFMSLLMMIGRLEMYTVFLIFLPSFWNPNKFRTG